MRPLLNSVDVWLYVLNGHVVVCVLCMYGYVVCVCGDVDVCGWWWDVCCIDVEKDRREHGTLRYAALALSASGCVVVVCGVGLSAVYVVCYVFCYRCWYVCLHELPYEGVGVDCIKCF